ncbi:DHH family phosphoesterase [Blattabacterium cuenoti]|uniref:DHH family phosphoesterase n=1 Tax=Blattabacterium cuenoti TaxID=1653831 RepID=UPI00163BF809|nr:bifunctional oligoribonuclease/PAP phosphatase NrnA [Blattabacterium cuenoti]
MFFNHNKNKIITIIIHKNPDGDALGSSLALMIYFRKLNYNVNLISPTNYSEYYSWLPGIKNIIVLSDNNKFFVKKKILDSDYIFLVDLNNFSRIGELKEFIKNSKSKKILIDHHPYPLNFDIMFHDSNAPATSILVFRFISNMNNLSKIDKDIATCLYVGLMTDTGYFRFPSINSETHFIASILMKKGINIYKIYNQLQENYNENKLKLLSIALKNLKIIKKYNIAYTSIRSSDIFYPYQQGDVDGIINYGLSIKNITFSVFFFEEKKNYPIKISFRSKGKLDVNLFARKYFSGGGHKNAAGGIIKKSLSETIKYFLHIIPIFYKNFNF